MSEYFSKRLKDIMPYTAGEQPQDKKYIKLNTNESPFPPSPFSLRLCRESAGDMLLYPDPEYNSLVKVAAQTWGVNEENLLFTNGSDEALNFAFIAYCDKDTPAVFPDITYGFYPVFAAINCVPKKEIPLKEDYTIDIKDYFNAGGTVFIANPNAPTGIALKKAEIEEIVANNPDNIVVIDEAYVDFGAESCVGLIDKYDNLIVTQTFSKSRSLAGARVGVAIASAALIGDLKTVKYSTNPYNLSRTSAAAGIGALLDEEYFNDNCEKIIEAREFFVKKLVGLGFSVLPSKANFVFAKYKDICGEKLYSELKNRGVLVRFFNKPRLKDFIRITIGTKSDMEKTVETVSEILKVIK
ncbi:MAG: histidinol-phosphate transaminase [Clostridia bacterium]|nr:histidinol-phosphate transaminase [Clostridia bacterium]